MDFNVCEIVFIVFASFYTCLVVFIYRFAYKYLEE